MPSSQILFDNMSNGQLRPNAIEDTRLLGAIGAVAREDFVPEAFKGSAYVDGDIPLGKDRYLLEPLVFATLLESIAPTSADHVLIVGGGLGYSAAVMAKLAAKIVLLESEAEFAEAAAERLQRAGISNVTIVQAALASGAPAAAPFDVILIEGGTQHVPPALLSQLRERGRLATIHCEQRTRGGSRGLGQYLLVTRDGQQFPRRIERSAFVHPLAEFTKPVSFAL